MLTLLLSVALVAATALLLSARFAAGSITEWLLGAYVTAFAEIVLVSLALSAASAFTRWSVLAALTLALAATVAAARSSRPPPLRAAARNALRALREPAMAVVGLLALGVVLYSVALALFTPPNDEDALSYHLARAAFWWQQEAVGYIAGAADSRLDEFAPNGEIAMAFTMVASGGGRAASLVQLVAALAAALAVYGIARRLGLEIREGLLGGLLFLTAPVVALQASTALNDVVVASLVACTAFFALGRSRADLSLTAVTAALLVGTKLTGILALPGLALVALLAHGRRTPRVLAALAAGGIAGGYWYAFNLAHGRDPFGGIGGERIELDAVAAIARVIRLLLASIELPGAVGLDRLLYVAAAAMVAAAAFVSAGPVRRRAVTAAIAGGATLLPLVLVPVAQALVRGSQKLFLELGRSDVGYLDPDRSATKASPIFSWYGPLGVLLTLLAGVLAVRAVRRGRLPAAALAVAAAPLLWIVLLGLGVPYWEWNGRYVMGGFGLGAALWGLVLRLPTLRWPTAVIAVLTTSLAFVHLHDRPSGLRLLEPTDVVSVWSQPDWRVQATDNPHLRALYGFFEEHVPMEAAVAVEPEIWPGGTNIGGNLPPYPFFRSDLTRAVVLATSAEAARRKGAEWAVFRGDACEPGWRRAFRHGVWVVLRRAPGASCP